MIATAARCAAGNPASLNKAGTGPVIQGSQGEPLRRVRVARKATSSFPHACASYNSAGDIPLCYKFEGQYDRKSVDHRRGK